MEAMKYYENDITIRSVRHRMCALMATRTCRDYNKHCYNHNKRLFFVMVSHFLLRYFLLSTFLIIFHSNNKLQKKSSSHEQREDGEERKKTSCTRSGRKS
ncbi:MAG: hypothetical protein ACI8RD_013220 [Bacillariaceae sp.]|jgi:hypothetical protein